MFLALAIALALQTTLAGLTLSAGMAVNLVLVAVVYIALVHGPLTGLLAGCAGGLIQDALAGAVVGVGGMAKTVIGFGVGVLGAQFIVAQPVPRFVMFAGATIVHEFCYQAVYALVQSCPVHVQYSAMLTQAVVNALVGLLAFAVAESVPGLVQRRESRKGSFTTRRF